MSENEAEEKFEIESEDDKISSEDLKKCNRKRKFHLGQDFDVVTPDVSEVATKRNRSTSTQATDGPLPLPTLPVLSSLSSSDTVPVLAPRVKVKYSAPWTEEQELYHQLAEELSGGMLSPVTLESDPVPFLTPPASPTNADGDKGETICEWPSNLVVDSAYSSAIELRALSPSSLLKLEVDDKKTHPSILPLPLRIRSVSEVSSTN